MNCGMLVVCCVCVKTREIGRDSSYVSEAHGAKDQDKAKCARYHNAWRVSWQILAALLWSSLPSRTTCELPMMPSVASVSDLVGKVDIAKTKGRYDKKSAFRSLP